MSRNRFNEKVRNLHFCNNEALATTADKAWKVMKVFQALQKTFLRAWTMTVRFSFDECVPRSSSRRTPTRTYMLDIPHKWDTKMFMACDVHSA